ncbi:hypothetical protein BDZ91DRAFT_715393 [Kalaharituber pfeilii]|nr:hypothetical protein BDZ91DRAFT_715393 [Kalaharituber pfeilii]
MRPTDRWRDWRRSSLLGADSKAGVQGLPRDGEREMNGPRGGRLSKLLGLAAVRGGEGRGGEGEGMLLLVLLLLLVSGRRARWATVDEAVSVERRV